MAFTASPTRFDHELIIGDTYQIEATVLDDDGVTPYSLVGATGTCQLRSEPGGTLLLSPTVTVTDAAAGEFTWLSDTTATGALVPGTGDLGVQFTFADSSVRHVLVGRVTIRPPVVA